MPHIPVLVNEMLDALAPRSGGVYFDGTLGGGGYSQALLDESAPDGRVIAVDADIDAVEAARERFEPYGARFVAVHAWFHEARTVLSDLEIPALSGAVLDLGLSSTQLDDPERGFSFRFTGPLDMRFDTSRGKSALEFLRTTPPKELERILREYGEERFARKVASRIHEAIRARKIEAVEDLVRVIERAVPKSGKIHPATRTFQALRIAVNGELDNLRIALEELPALLEPGGGLCVISYHSLEDRIVKHAFRALYKKGFTKLFDKPLTPGREEIWSNRRARSAKLREAHAPASCDDTIPF